MYSWPIEAIQAMADATPRGADRGRLKRELAGAGYGDSLIELLGPLYEHADGTTFFDGALRLLPLDGFVDEKVPGLVEWNQPDDWKAFAPPRGQHAFYFMANAFGDQFGVPLDADLEVARDRFAVLWVEKYEYEEAGITWAETLEAILADEEDTAKYFARLAEYEWAVEELGIPELWQCFSSKMPAILGGDDTLDNVEIRALSVHVSFTLQVLQSAVGTPPPAEA